MAGENSIRTILSVLTFHDFLNVRWMEEFSRISFLVVQLDSNHEYYMQFTYTHVAPWGLGHWCFESEKTSLFAEVMPNVLILPKLTAHTGLFPNSM